MLLTSTCMVQDGRVPEGQRRELEAALKGAVRDHVGPKARLAITWMTIRRGSGYAAGKPSTSSLVQVGVPDGFSQPTREALMHDVNERWCGITGQTPFELLVSAMDQTAGRRMVGAIFGQIPLNQKPKFLKDHLPQAIRSLAGGR